MISNRIPFKNADKEHEKEHEKVCYCIGKIK